MMRFHALEFSDPGAIATALGIRKGSWYWKNQVWESALELVWKISLILALSSVLPSDINWAPVTERLSTRDTVVNKIDMILWNYISATWKYSLAHIKLKNLENGKKKKKSHSSMSIFKDEFQIHFNIWLHSYLYNLKSIEQYYRF